MSLISIIGFVVGAVILGAGIIIKRITKWKLDDLDGIVCIIEPDEEIE